VEEVLPHHQISGGLLTHAQALAGPVFSASTSQIAWLQHVLYCPPMAQTARTPKPFDALMQHTVMAAYRAPFFPKFRYIVC
jgi:hypothetical protein